MFLRLAFRNVWRRKVQSILAILAVATGLMVTVWMVNFQYGTWDITVNTSVRSVSGHLVVQPEGFQESKDRELLIADSAEVALAVTGNVPADAVVLRRAMLDGLATSAGNVQGVGVAVQAVEPEAEARVNVLPDKVHLGTWLTADSGQDPVQASDAVIGVDLARRLAVEVGDRIVVTVSYGHEMNGLPFTVIGIFETGSPQIDGFLAVIPLITAQELVGTGDDPASQVAVELDGMYAHRPLIGPIEEALVSRPVEVLGWNEAMPELEAMMQMDIRFAWLIWPVLGIVVSIGVLNTLLMSLFERTRELGVLLAVGMRPRQVFALVVTEGIILSGIGVALGLAAGALLTWPAVEWGFYIPLMQSAAPVDNVAFDGRFFSSWALGADLVWAVIFGLLGVVAAAWPAFRAARFDPVVSMRQA